MRKWVIIAGIIMLSGIGFRTLSKAATPMITESHQMYLNQAFAGGDAEPYRELCGFVHGRWQSRQWFRNRDFVARAGIIVPDQPHTKIGGSMLPSGESSLVCHGSIGVAPNSPDAQVDGKYGMLLSCLTLDVRPPMRLGCWSGTEKAYGRLVRHHS